MGAATRNGPDPKRSGPTANEDSTKIMKFQEALEQGASVSESLKTLLLSTTIFIVCIIVIVVSFRELMSTRLVIRAFDVPKAMEEKGVSGQVLSKHIMDRYYRIYREAGTLKESFPMAPKWDREDISFGSEDTQFAMDAIRQVLGYFNTRTTVISGDVTESGGAGRFELSLRLNGEHIATREGSLKEIIDRAAQDIILKTQPYIMANYYYTREHNEEDFTRILDRILEDHSKGPASMEEHAWAYVLKGWLLEQKKQYEQALAYYRKAAAKKDQFALPLRNQAVVLRKLGRLDESVQVCRAWLAIDRNSWMAHFNMGLAFAMKKDLPNARTAFDNALAHKKEKNWAYIEIMWAYMWTLYSSATAYESGKEFAKAAQTYKEALRLDRRSDSDYLKKKYVETHRSSYYNARLSVLCGLKALLEHCGDSAVRDPKAALAYAVEIERVTHICCPDFQCPEPATDGGAEKK